MQLDLLTPLYLLAIYGVVVYFGRPKKDIKGITWSPLESVGITLFIFFFGQIAGGFLAYLIPALLGWDDSKSQNWLSENTIGQFVLILLIEAVTMLLIVRFLKRRKSSLKAIGLSRKPNLKDVGYALLGFVGYFALLILTTVVAKALIPGLDTDQEQQIGFKDVSTLTLPLVFISLVILPPLVEEITTRGLLYSGLKTKLVHWQAVIVTSGLFAIAHLQIGSGEPLLWIAAIDTFVLSAVLIYLKDKTGSLWTPIFLHALKNFVAFLSIFVFSVAR